MDIKEFIDKRYDFSPVLNLKMIKFKSFLIENKKNGRNCFKMSFEWEKSIKLIFCITEMLDDSILNNLIGQKLTKILDPMPNHSTISVGWVFEDGKTIFLNIIGEISWG